MDLPAETTEMNPVGISGGDLFSLRIRLTIIQGKVHDSISSTKALRISEKERSIAAKELDAVLDARRRGVPTEFASADFDTLIGASGLRILLPKVILNFTCFNALSTIHHFFRVGLPWHIGSTEPRARPQPPIFGFLNDAVYLKEARQSTRFFLMMPQG